MKRNSQVLAEHLADAGVTTFFGVQGGASAHLIEATCENQNTTFIPVLNEQAAGLAAHGHYFSTGRAAGGIVTCGPGFFNLVTGIAACFYDNIPAVFLCGQVNAAINLAEKFGTKMYGFQEAPNSALAQYISDTCLKVRNDEELAHALNAIAKINSRDSNGPLVLEIQDDFQRFDFAVPAHRLSTAHGTTKVVENETTTMGAEHLMTALMASNNPLFLFGGGISRAAETAATVAAEITELADIPAAFTWGGQRLRKAENPNHVGLFGGHSPGTGNSLLHASDLVIGFGVGLLQHQAGKAKEKFAPDARIIVVNRDANETARYAHDFGDRLEIINGDAAGILSSLNDKLKNNKINRPYWSDYRRENGTRDWCKNVSREVATTMREQEPVSALTAILSACPQDYWAFSDAGATLSWTYQAASECAAPPVTTSFNLHTMGYALPAAIGAAAAGDRPGVLSISGDGGFMMNVQELAVARSISVPIKIVLINNEGYGIIRQTQDAFLGGRHFGSAIGPLPNLPDFNLKQMIEGFGFETIEGSAGNIDTVTNWLFAEGSGHRVAIVNVDKTEIVEHTTPNFEPLVF
jgi:acetolactate synthase-1/2/3 large subunit